MLRRHAGRVVVDNIWRGLSAAGRMVPAARPERHGVECIRDVAYRDSSRVEHRLDVYRPQDVQGPLPVVIYVHGGGFRVLSKDTHWVMGIAFARAGYVVFNVSYRLAPRDPFPAGLEDVAAAFAWVRANAARYGGDASRLVLAGESAGANLVTALTIASCQRRPEPWAHAVFEADAVPRAVIPACGLLQVTDPDRYRREHGISWFIHDQLEEVTHAYLGAHASTDDPALALADPLCVLECEAEFERPLPPFFAPVGTADPLIEDNRRLARVLARRGVPHRAPEYPGEPHAFHALVFRRNARRCWRDIFAFLRDTGV
ncbi:MAG: alpha/beta hydrolase [Deltaproteobacteria bacterium]|nr:alpha/beta hydrolase [Deltaproteobacteria bacterium]